MVNRYAEARREYREVNKRCDELRQKLNDAYSQLEAARHLMRERFHEAIREQVLGEVKYSGRIEFRHLKTSYCSADGFTIAGENIPRLTRRALLEYIDELALRGVVRKSNENADGRRILVLYTA